MLTDIAFTNFRSLRSVQLQLKPITLVIGPNASGKSNLFKALRFLHDAVAGDLRDWQSYDSLIDDLVWFGTDDRGERPEEIETTLGFQHLPAVQPLTYKGCLSGRTLPGNPR
ncbi:MAG TPA: AAA family ATPase [Thermoanaerobaculia bacterium]|jgi:predicted ATPase